MIKILLILLNINLFFRIQVDAYYLEGEFPFCKATSQVVDFERSCKLGLGDTEFTLKKIYEILCFENLNDILDSNVNDDMFFSSFVFGKKVTFYKKEGSFFYANCSKVKILEIKESSNTSSCSNDLPVVFRSNDQDILGYLSSSGIVRENRSIISCNDKFLFFNFNNQQYVKYRNHIRKRILNTSPKPINVSNPFGEQENGFLDLYEKNVFSNTKKSIMKDLAIFLIIFILMIVSTRKDLKLFLNHLLLKLKSRLKRYIFLFYFNLYCFEFFLFGLLITKDVYKKRH